MDSYLAHHEKTFIDGIGYDGGKPPEQHYFYHVIYEEFESIITAEQMMIANYEELLRYGTPSNRKIVFTESKSFSYTRDDFIRMYETGKKYIKTMVKIMAALNSKKKNRKKVSWKVSEIK